MNGGDWNNTSFSCTWDTQFEVWTSVPVRTGYNFVAWKDAQLPGTFHQPGDILTAVNTHFAPSGSRLFTPSLTTPMVGQKHLLRLPARPVHLPQSPLIYRRKTTTRSSTGRSQDSWARVAHIHLETSSTAILPSRLLRPGHLTPIQLLSIPTGHLILSSLLSASGAGTS